MGWKVWRRWRWVGEVEEDGGGLGRLEDMGGGLRRLEEMGVGWGG